MNEHYQNTNGTPENKPIEGITEEDQAYFEAIGRKIALAHSQYEGVKGQVTERLDPKPLTEAHLEDLLKLSTSDSNEDVINFINRKASLTPEQSAQFDAYRGSHQREMVHEKVYDRLRDLRENNPDYLNNLIALAPPDVRKGYFEFTRTEAEKAKAQKRTELIENASQLGREEDFLILHSLKLAEPERFKEVFNGLPGSAKAKFDAFEAREDARVKAANPEFSVPKLSVNGQTWLKQEVPRKSIVDMDSGGPEKTVTQMQAEGIAANEDQRTYVQSTNSNKKPSLRSRLKGWFARKIKPDYKI